MHAMSLNILNFPAPVSTPALGAADPKTSAYPNWPIQVKHSQLKEEIVFTLS